MPIDAAPVTPHGSADPLLPEPLRSLAGKQTTYFNGGSTVYVANAAGTALYELKHWTTSGWELRTVTKWSHHYQGYCYRRMDDADSVAACLTFNGDVVDEVKGPSANDRAPSLKRRLRITPEWISDSWIDTKAGSISPAAGSRLLSLTGLEKGIPPALLAQADAAVRDFEGFITYSERHFRRTLAWQGMKDAERAERSAWFKSMNSLNAGLSNANQALLANREPPPSYTAAPAPARIAQPGATVSATAPQRPGVVPAAAPAVVPPTANAAPVNRPVAKPANVAEPATAASPQKASTDEDPARCVSQPSQGRNPLCKDGTAFAVRNGCEQAVDVRLCIKTTQGIWDCGVSWGVKPGASWSFPSCRGTSTSFMDVRSSGSNRRFNDPPR